LALIIHKPKDRKQGLHQFLYSNVPLASSMVFEGEGCPGSSHSGSFVLACDGEDL